MDKSLKEKKPKEKEFTNLKKCYWKKKEKQNC